MGLTRPFSAPAFDLYCLCRWASGTVLPSTVSWILLFCLHFFFCSVFVSFVNLLL